MAQVISRPQIIARPQGVWGWIIQRITAVLLFVFLGVHLAVLHFVPANMDINFLGVAARFQSLLYLITDTGLLITGMYHALNGVRNVMFDFVVDDHKRRAINVFLIAAGVAFTLWGTYALFMFLKG